MDLKSFSERNTIMTIKVDYKFTPFRLVMRRKEPVAMEVVLKNTGTDNAKLSVKVVLSRELSLDKGGLKTAALERIDSLESGATKIFHYDISAKHSTTAGDHPIHIIVDEHYRDYTYIKNSNKTEAELQVE